MIMHDDIIIPSRRAQTRALPSTSCPSPPPSSPQQTHTSSDRAPSLLVTRWPGASRQRQKQRQRQRQRQRQGHLLVIRWPGTSSSEIQKLVFRVGENEVEAGLLLPLERSPAQIWALSWERQSRTHSPGGEVCRSLILNMTFLSPVLRGEGMVVWCWTGWWQRTGT